MAANIYLSTHVSVRVCVCETVSTSLIVPRVPLWLRHLIPKFIIMLNSLQLTVFITFPRSIQQIQSTILPHCQ